jgi:hypothetical protein
MTKYREYVKKMLEENPELFENFKKLHDEYALNSDGLQEEFNRQGETVLGVIRDYENRLCLQSEKGGYAKFTPALSEKFQAEIKKIFPMIDHIGLKTDVFSIKKIKLF